MTETSAEERVESLSFQADVQQLLDILSRSLYTEREIFLRELVSNASDALHRIQFEMLTNREVLGPDAELAIRIDFDEDAKTLSVSDSGIGMTRGELIENLGTIARSGAAAFLERLEAGQRPADIIGQFGVGFYAVFMVADEVKVTSRSYELDATAWTWTSRGDSTYTLEPAEKSDRGTAVEITLKEDAHEFASKWRLEQIVTKHSDYVSFPIYVKESVTNRQTAIWRKQRQEVTEEEYNDFYRQLTLDYEPPLLSVHMVSDAPVDIRSILFIPRKLDRFGIRPRSDYGLRLYSKKILIQEHSKELLPEYLRFVEGVVDSEDIPLNISRETVQSNKAIRQIQKALTGRLLRALKEMADEKPDDYQLFWGENGVFIKEGIATNPFGNEELLPLLRFHSSRGEDGLVSLTDYVARMDEAEKTIYYVLGEDLESVAHSPHLDYFNAHDLEVLYLTDAIDGFMMQNLREFEGKPLRNVDDAGLELPVDELTPDGTDTDIDQDSFDQLVNRVKQVLDDQVAEVRASKVLQDSACRLVSPENDPGRDLQRVRRLLNQDFEVSAKILEINRSHPLIRNLARLIEEQSDDDRIDLVITQMFENILLLEGSHPNPAQMVPRLQTLLEAAMKGPE